MIPNDLTERDQWVLWQYEERDGKRTKVPYRPNHQRASSTNMNDWTSFARVSESLKKNPTFAGVGFVFTPEDPFVGIDLDGCLDSGELKPWARPIVETFADTYMEISPSGNGLKIFAKGKLPGKGRRRDFGTHAIEVYGAGRFFTVTGNVFHDAPLQVEEHQADIERLYAMATAASTVNGHVVGGDGNKILQGKRHTTLVSLAGSMRRRGMGREAIEAALWAENLTKCVPPYDREHINKLAESAADWEAPLAPATNDLLAFHHNDSGNAGRLIACSGDDLRYCYSLKKWLIWDGRRWAVDETGQSRKLAKRAMLKFLNSAIERNAPDAEKFARGSLDAKRISNLLSMAECETFVTPDQLDVSPDLLNFLNGTVDLRSSELRPHTREDYLTKLVHYDYRPQARCERWFAFLDEIMGGGPDASEGGLERAERLIDYLQRALGYSLTGSTIEKAIFILFGDGDNGKSTLLTTYRKLIPEYSVLLQVDTLMVRQESNNTQADLADLRGARFVQTSEAEEGQRLAQGKLKRLSQGMGKIKATRKYENPIEFAETHKLFMDTNRKPEIRDADDAATFNRLHPIPFTVRIAKDRIDRELPAKLLAEAEGILAWAVAGARLWYRHGLSKPREVKEAEVEWHSEADQFGRFLDERCSLGDGFSVLASALYGEYRRWCENTGEHFATAQAFGRKMTDRRIEKRKTFSGSRYQGICVRP